MYAMGNSQVKWRVRKPVLPSLVILIVLVTYLYEKWTENIREQLRKR